MIDIETLRDVEKVQKSLCRSYFFNHQCGRDCSCTKMMETLAKARGATYQNNSAYIHGVDVGREGGAKWPCS